MQNPRKYFGQDCKVKPTYSGHSTSFMNDIIPVNNAHDWFTPTFLCNSHMQHSPSSDFKQQKNPKNHCHWEEWSLYFEFPGLWFKSSWQDTFITTSNLKPTHCPGIHNLDTQFLIPWAKWGPCCSRSTRWTSLCIARRFSRHIKFPDCFELEREKKEVESGSLVSSLNHGFQTCSCQTYS